MKRVWNSKDSISQCIGLAVNWRQVLVSKWCLFFAGALATLGCHAESQLAASTTRARLDFRITIPAIIRVTPLVQPERIVIEDRHIAQGYIDLDTGTAVKLTVNTRAGYVLSASYNSALLAGVELRISNQNLTISSGYGSMQVASGFMTDKIVPIAYRLHLASGVQAGEYRWPIALAFSLPAA